MKDLDVRQQLIQLDQVLIELDKEERDYKDIINNVRAAVQLDLEWLQECESIKLDDYSELKMSIQEIRAKIRFLEAHPDFCGDLIALRDIMAEEEAPDTLRSWDPHDTITPPDSR